MNGHCDGSCGWGRWQFRAVSVVSCSRGTRTMTPGSISAGKRTAYQAVGKLTISVDKGTFIYSYHFTIYTLSFFSKFSISANELKYFPLSSVVQKLCPGVASLTRITPKHKAALWYLVFLQFCICICITFVVSKLCPHVASISRIAPPGEQTASCIVTTMVPTCNCFLSFFSTLLQYEYEW